MERAGWKFIRAIFSPLVRFFYPAKILGRENLILDKRAIYISNHLSNLDAPSLAVRLFKKDFYVLGKEELFNTKAGQTLFGAIGVIPVKRDATDVSAVKRVLKTLKDEKQLLVFPEGTRNKGDYRNVMPFKSGIVAFAQKTSSPIIPIIAYKKPKLFRRNLYLIGKPIYITTDKSPEIKDAVCEDLQAEFLKMRLALDNFKKNKSLSELGGYIGN